MTHKFIQVRLLGAVVFLFFLSCSQLSQAGLKDPDVSDAPWIWGDVSRKDFIEYEKNNQDEDGPPASYLSETHPATKQFQVWTDAIWGRLVAVHPELARAPRPLILIADSPESNGWVSPVLLCLKAPIRFEGGKAPRASASGSKIPALTSGENPYLQEIQPGTCNDGTLDPKRLDEVVSWLRDSGHLCRDLKVTDGVLVVPSSCEIEDNDRNALAAQSIPEEADAIIFSSTARFVILTQSMIKEMTGEGDVFATLAHELTHYWRAHASIADSVLNYYYVGDRSNRALSPEVEQLIQRLEKAPADKIAPMKGQIFHPAMFAGTYPFRSRFPAKISDFCGEGDCVKACERFDWTTKRTDSVFKRELMSGPLDALSRAQYDRYEKGLAECAKSLPVTDASFEEVKESFSVEVSESLSAAGAKTVFDLLKRVAASYASSDKRRREIFAQAYKMRLGYFTSEQEADEGAVSILAMIGQDPRLLGDGYLELMKLNQDVRQKGSISFSYEACKKARSRGWRTTKGKEIVAPIGAFSDDHHGLCYRVYNADRAARTQTVSKDPIPLKPIDWLELKKTLLTL